MDNPIRPVARGELRDSAGWIIPQYLNRHPRLTIEGMLPLLEEAVAHPVNYRLVQTSNACGLFAIERSPWEPLSTVCDIFVAGRPGVKSAPFEVCRIYQHGVEFAKEIGAVEFRFGTDGLSDLSAIAQRIGYDIIATNYVKRL